MIGFKGITDRLEFEQEKSRQRVEKLAGFQIKILRSAMTRYPNVRRVVYSTCSIYPEENEDVIRQVLETNSYFKLVPAKQFVNDTWLNVGSPDYGEIGQHCLYAKPHDDFTNGFFVAVFDRLEEGEENQFFNTKIYNYKKHVQSQENRRKRKQQEDEVNIEGQDYQETDQMYENSTETRDQEANEKKRNRKKIDILANDDSVSETKHTDEEIRAKKTRKKSESEFIENWGEDHTKPTKQKKKKKSKELCDESTGTIVEDNDVSVETVLNHGSKKKKKNKELSSDCLETAIESSEAIVKKKKKKKKSVELEQDDENKEELYHENLVKDTVDVVKRKKKKNSKVAKVLAKND